MNSLYLLIFCVVPFLVPDGWKRQTSIGVITLLSVVYGLVAIGELCKVGELQELFWEISSTGAIFSLLFVVSFVPVLLLNTFNIRNSSGHKALFYSATVILFVSSYQVLLGLGGELSAQNSAYGRLWHFLFSWELMSVSSFMLLLFEVQKRADFHNAVLYFLLMHIGFISIFYGLVQIGDNNQHILFGEGVMGIVSWLLIFIGLAFKSAIFPLHFWLPRTYGLSLGGASSLMSISSTNLGVIGVFYATYHTQSVYGISMTLMILGMLSALYGAFMMIRTTKLLGVLSYSSIESLGVILFGFGFAYFAKNEGYGVIAFLAVIGAILKLFSHAMAKAQMLSVCGGVQFHMGGNKISQYNALEKKIPNHTLGLLVGVQSFALVPIFGSFLAEFFLLYALFEGINVPELSVISIIAMMVVALCVSSTVYSFIKMLGVAFLGAITKQTDSIASDYSLLVRIGQIILGGISTVGLWLLTYWMLGQGSDIFGVNVGEIRWLYDIYLSLLIVVVVLVVVFGGLWALRHYINKGREEIITPPLGRGIDAPTSSVLSAESFCDPANQMLSTGFNRRSTPKPNHLRPLTLRIVYKLTNSLAFFQTGRISHYVLHILLFLTMVLILTLSGLL